MSTEPTVTTDADQNPAGQPRFAEQCYLLWNWSTFHKQNLSQTYSNFTVLMGEPSMIINRLLSKKGIERLFELKPVEVSALVPKIRIFKSRPGGGADQELIFQDHTSRSSIENIMKSGYGRGDGIGIKGFDYELEGGAPKGGAAMVQKGSTKLNFKFLFQNLEMLVHRSEGHPALIDLLTLPPASDQPPLNCPEGGAVNISHLWDTKEFVMKVVYGWAVPNGSLISNDLKAAIRGAATTLMVNTTGHDLDFQLDGSVQLSVDATGYADAVLRDPLSDVLWLDKKRSKNQDMKKTEIEDTKKELDEAKKLKEEGEKEEATAEKEQSGWQDLGDMVGLGSDANQDAEKKIEDAEAVIDKKEEEVKAAAKAYDKDAAANKVFVYQRLLNALNTSGRILYFDLTPEQITAYEADVAATLKARSGAGAKAPAPASPEASDTKGPEEKEKEIAEAKPAEQEELEKKDVEGNESTQPEIKPQTADPGETPVGDNNTAVEKAVEKTVEDPEGAKKDLEKHIETNLVQTGGQSPINRVFYFYYGDLLDVVFGVLNDNPAAINIRSMLGPISFTDAKTNVKTICNLADIPISLNKFLEWFNRNVVGEGVTEYLLEKFVKDTIKGLLMSALGDDCWESQGAPTPSPTVAMIPLIVPGTGEGGQEARIPKGGRLNVGDISSVNIKELVPGTEDRSATGLHTYIYIYSYAWSAGDLNGDPAADYDKGIYHLNIGGDRGLVKSMKFSKISMPHIEASRALKQSCDLRHLQQAYKIVVEMIGNSIFKPGQMVYINPSTMGSGDPQSRRLITEKLGLGGYYTIQKVSGDITAAGFRTTIEGVREHGSENSDPKTQPPTDGAAATEPPVDAIPDNMTLPKGITPDQ